MFLLISKKNFIRYTFSKEEKLKGKKLIEYTFEKGHNLYMPSLKIWYCFKNEINPSIYIHSAAKCLIGVGVSKRYFKRAVDRNRIKRLIREAYRLQKHILLDSFSTQSNQLFCFIQYTQATIPTFDMVYSKMEILLQKLAKIVHEITINS